MDTSKLPEARLIFSNLDGTPLYLVFKTDKGWVGAPGLRKGRFLTDEDVKDAIPYVPAPQPQALRIGVDIRFKRVMERTQGERPLWLSVSGNVTLDDDEVVELTEHESVEVGEDPTAEVADFLGARSYGIHDAASDVPSYHFRDGEFQGEIDLSSGTRVWRTQNVFYVLHPDQQYFQLHTRVRNP